MKKYKIIILVIILIVITSIIFFTLNNSNKDINKNKLSSKSDNISSLGWDPIREVNKPKLVSGMIPVKWNGTNFVVCEDTDSSWYDYSNQKWANVRTEDGSLWVWIPRYAYKIEKQASYYGNHADNGGIIDIKFLQGTTNNDNIGKLIDNSYIVEPCFTNETSNCYSNGGWDTEITGIWVAKTTAAYADISSEKLKARDSNLIYGNYGTITAKSNIYGEIAGNTKITYPVFIPNMYIYNNINISDSYDLCKHLKDENNPYGFTSNTADTHQIKNSEWGAVAYLTQSKYGRNGTNVLINSANVNISELQVYGVTAGGIVTNDLIHDKLEISVESALINNKLQSTTGNETGIYDMAGGALEMTSGYINNINDDKSKSLYGKNLVNDGDPNISIKYKSVYMHDIYFDTNSKNYKQNINTNRVGEAIWETSQLGYFSTSWFGNTSGFIASKSPFLVRGGTYNTKTESGNSEAGPFAFSSSDGSASIFKSFRAVIIVNN